MAGLQIDDVLHTFKENWPGLIVLFYNCYKVNKILEESLDAFLNILTFFFLEVIEYYLYLSVANLIIRDI